MVKMHNVKQYLTDGIENNINNCEDAIISEYSNETPNSFEVEFTDYSMDGDKSKYRITIENIDEIMDEKKREKLYREHSHEIFNFVYELCGQLPVEPLLATDEEKKQYEKELKDFRESKGEEIRKIFMEMGFKLKDTENSDDENNIKENKPMDARVEKFLKEIMNGTEPNVAIDSSGVGEMKFKDVLKEIEGAWKANQLEEILNCEEKIPNEEYQKLKEALNAVREFDKVVSELRDSKSESN